MSSASPILPGATLGVLGGGQLGRMFALAARSMGYRVHIYTTEDDAPAAQVADHAVVAGYTDTEAVRTFAQGVSVVTFEFENVPSSASEVAERHTAVRPAGRVLHITQQRLREKRFLHEHGFPVTPFRPVNSLDDLRDAASTLGLPAVLKTAGFGYDGKGQRKLSTPADLAPAWQAVGPVECIYEAWVDYDRELSVVAARGLDGRIAAFPVFENQHSRHILDITCCPARIDPGVAKEAASVTAGILEALDVVGLLTVELFLTRSGRLLVNELAPRPHNSGHLTIDACVTSQFEQQLRAVCGLPLGDVTLRAPAAMVNLLGDLWDSRTPDWRAALADPAVKLHLYGKTEARPGRKMGHLTAVAGTVNDAMDRLQRARQALVS